MTKRLESFEWIANRFIEYWINSRKWINVTNSNAFAAQIEFKSEMLIRPAWKERATKLCFVNFIK